MSLDQQQLSVKSDFSASYDPNAAPIKTMPQSLRPREEFERRGADNVPDDVLLAIILRSGAAGKNVAALAREILLYSGGLENLSRMGCHELRSLKIRGLGKVKAMELAAALELGRRAAMAVTAVREATPALRQPQEVYELLAPLTLNLSQEVFWVIMLDIKNRVIGQPVEATRGLLNSSPVHPREIFKSAVRHSAASVILAHNHPSGDVEPSNEDIMITKRLIEAAKIMGIAVLDHVIIGKPLEGKQPFLSMRQRKLVYFDTDN